MRRQAHELNAAGGKIQGELPRRLYRIAMHHHPGAPGSLAELRNILNDADFIIGAHHRNQARPGSQGRQQGRVRYPPQLIHGNDIHTPALRGQGISGLQDRGMLYGAHRQTLAGETLHHALQGKIIGLGTTAGKNHLGRIDVDQGRHLLPRLVHGGTNHAARGMDAGGIGVVIAQIWRHRRPYPWVQRCSGVVIEIDVHAPGTGLPRLFQSSSRYADGMYPHHGILAGGYLLH